MFLLFTLLLIYPYVSMIFTRRNVIKLTLYRHFSNALAFAIVSLIAFEIWWIHLTSDGCIQVLYEGAVCVLTPISV